MPAVTRLPAWRRKKTYTGAAAVLVATAFVLTLVTLLSSTWFSVAGAPKQNGRHYLLRYGLLGACYRSEWEEEGGDTEEDCHPVNPFDCSISIMRLNPENTNPGVDSVLFSPGTNCHAWETGVAMFLNGVLFFALSGFLTAFTAFVISPALSLGAATSLFIATISVFVPWAIATSTRDHTIEDTAITATISHGFVLAGLAWVFGLVAFLIEVTVSLKGVRRSYTSTFTHAYADDDNGTVASSAPLD